MRYPAIAVIAFTGAVYSHGQWLNYHDPAIPRGKDGKPNLSAPTPHADNGKPDLSGVWQAEPTPSDEMTRMFGDVTVFRVLGDDVLTFNKHFLNILADFKPEESPLKPEVAERFRSASQNRGLEVQQRTACPRACLTSI